MPSTTAYSPDIIPRHILRPAYATTGQVLTELIPAQPVIWSEQQVDKVSGDTQSYKDLDILPPRSGNLVSLLERFLTLFMTLLSQEYLLRI